MALHLRSLTSKLPTCASCVTNGILSKNHLELTSAYHSLPNPALLPQSYYKPSVIQKAQLENLSSQISKLSAETKNIDFGYFSKCMPFSGPASSMNFQDLSRLNAVPQPDVNKATRNDEGVESSEGKKSPNSDGKPSQEQLDRVANALESSLNKFYYQSFDYRIISPDIVLEDNIRGKTYRGLSQYVQQIFLVRFVGHMKFAFVETELLSLAKFPQEGRITIRWRIKGISGLRIFLKFWRYKLWEFKRVMNQSSTWIDGISHYDVGPDGLVYRHVIDKIEEDKEESMDRKKEKKLRLAAKLAGASSAYSQLSREQMKRLRATENCSLI